MDKLLAIPSIILLMMLQIGIFSNITLIHGRPDIVLVAVIAWALNERVKSAWEWAIFAGLAMGFISALPAGAVLAGYVAITGFARLLQKRVWQTPLLAMFVTTLLGTLIMMGIAIVDLRFNGSTFLFKDALSQIVLPTVLMNLMIALPIHILFLDFADWVYPIKDET
jgi:rod shape-determining protein MreD